MEWQRNPDLSASYKAAYDFMLAMQIRASLCIFPGLLRYEKVSSNWPASMLRSFGIRV